MATNIKTIVGLNPNIKAYTPLLECIVNSINSIQEKGNKDGEIGVKIIRHIAKQGDINGEVNNESPILGFEITDNGIGFNDEKTNAFDEPFTDNNFKNGGIGYGRFTSLRIFDEILINSVYKEKGIKKKRTILFKISQKHAKNRNIITEENVLDIDQSEQEKTTIKLSGIKSERINKYDSKTNTIAKRITEDLLPYLINSTENFPKIYVYDDTNKETLNDFIKESGHIWKIDTKGNDVFKLKNLGEQELGIALIGFYGSQKQASEIILTAHNRSVTNTSIHKYVPEFTDPFIKEEKKGEKNHYYIKVYISGKYLDDNVNFQRESFNFGSSNGLFNNITQEDIEKEVANIIKRVYNDEYKARAENKKNDISNIINKEMPYLQGVLKNTDITELPYNADSKKLASILYQKKYEQDTKLREDFETFFKEGFSDDEDNQKKFNSLMLEISNSQRDSLIQYVCNRKLAIESLKELLKFSHEVKKFPTEDKLHNLIFSMKTDSEETDYDSHNLRILDERLVFSKYITSDKSIFSNNGQRVDLAIFGNDTMYRDNNDSSTPVFVYEFKRPGDALEKKDHIAVLKDYLNKIRKGEIKEDLNKRPLNIANGTPIYGYLICDLSEEMMKYITSHDFTVMSDGKGYYLRYTAAKCYIEVLSWDKVVEDSEKRHKAFFAKLGIE